MTFELRPEFRGRASLVKLLRQRSSNCSSPKLGVKLEFGVLEEQREG